MKWKWQQFPILPILISYIVGVLLYTSGAVTNISWSLAFSLLCFVILLAASLFRAKHYKIYYYRNTALLLGSLGLGITLTAWNDAWNNRHFIGHHLSDSQYIQIRLLDNPMEKNKTFLLSSEVVGYYIGNSLYPAVGKANIYMYKNDSILSLRQGSVLVLPSKLVRIKNSGNPYSFDFAQYAAYQQLYFQGYFAYKDIVAVRDVTGTISWLQNLRVHLIKTLQHHIHDPTTQSVVLAMLLNERALLHDDIWQAYSATGIVHIISISGMHIQIFLAIVLFLMMSIKHKKHRWIKYVVALVLVWLYVLLTHYPASAVRAGVMFTITALAVFLNREESKINTLAVAAWLMLLFQPYWLFSLGMQLSFLCMLSIYLFYQPVRNLLFFKHKLLLWLWEGFAMSIAVQILVAPIVVYYFHQFPLFVLLVNIPAGIYSSILMIGGLLIMVFGNWLPLDWIGSIMAWCTELFNNIVFFFATHTPKMFSQFALDALATLLLTSVLVSWSVYWLLAKNEKWLYLAWLMSILFIVDRTSNQYYLASQDKLVIYQYSGQSLIQKIQGFRQYIHSSPLEDDMVIEKYLHTPNLHWSITAASQQLPPNSLFQWRTKNVIILDNQYIKGKPTDILIVNNHSNLDPEYWQQNFQPQLLVLDSSFPRWKAKKWVEKLNSYNFVVYSVTLQGALVLE
jgi:competence protein ComEC